MLAFFLAPPFGAEGKSKGLSGYSIYVESPPPPEEAQSDPNTKARERQRDDFSVYLTPAFMKWNVLLRIVADADKADMILANSGTSRARRWHEGRLTHRGESSRVAVEVVDRCGNLLWTESARDRS